MKIFFACGGSAGHINPAIAMAEYLQRSFPDASFLFFGRADGMEQRRIAEAGFPFHPIRIQGVKRKLTAENLRALRLMLTARREIAAILAQDRPSLVIGTGGYVCYPLLTAARSQRIPSLLHESNAIPGLAVKLLEGRVSRMLLQYEDCRRHLRHPERCEVIGAPLRRGFHTVDRATAKRRLGITNEFTVLSFGGSQGAERINEVCLSLMARPTAGLRHIHVCGEAHYEALCRRYPQAARGGSLFAYIKDMPLYMAAADLIICRAGALTLAELSALGKASILIPSPNVPADHQSKNAALYEQRGAAVVVREADLTEALLKEKIDLLRRDTRRRADMERAAFSLHEPHTEARFIEIVRNYI